MARNRFFSILSGCALALAVSFASRDSSAGWADGVTIQELTVDPSGVAYFKLNVTLDTPATCVASVGGFIGQSPSTNRMSLAFDSTTPGGKNILSLVISAYLAGKPVKVQGTGACMATSGGSIEVLNAFRSR